MAYTSSIINISKIVYSRCKMSTVNNYLDNLINNNNCVNITTGK